MADEGLRLGRLADRVEGSLDDYEVYAVVEGSPCGVPEDPFTSRLVDVVYSSDLGRAAEVYGYVARCQKDWLEEPAFIDHTCAGTPGPPVRLSREVRFRGNSMEDCAAGGVACPTANLTYNYSTGRWEGELDLVNGPATLQFYCTFDGVDYHWFLEVGGCAYPGGAVPLTPTCSYPPLWSGTGNAVFSGCCGDLTSLPGAVFFVEGLVEPLYDGRMVDHAGGYEVYAIDEFCEDECVETTGCCPGTPIDSLLEYTIFNISGCGCGAAIEAGPVTSLGCQTFGLTGCSTSFTLCLACSGYETGRTWRNYRLAVGTTLYPPTSGSCDPLSVTFDNVSVAMDVGPYGTCYGTISVTVTRP